MSLWKKKKKKNLIQVFALACVCFCLTPVSHIGKLKTHLRNELRRVKYWTCLTSVYTDRVLRGSHNVRQHDRWQNKNKKKYGPAVRANIQWFLSWQEKHNFVLHNVYGQFMKSRFDIDLSLTVLFFFLHSEILSAQIQTCYCGSRSSCLSACTSLLGFALILRNRLARR